MSSNEKTNKPGVPEILAPVRPTAHQAFIEYHDNIKKFGFAAAVQKLAEQDPLVYSDVKNITKAYDASDEKRAFSAVDVERALRLQRIMDREKYLKSEVERRTKKAIKAERAARFFAIVGCILVLAWGFATGYTFMTFLLSLKNF